MVELPVSHAEMTLCLSYHPGQTPRRHGNLTVCEGEDMDGVYQDSAMGGTEEAANLETGLPEVDDHCAIPTHSLRVGTNFVRTSH